jgi:alcohol dehydrogenase class IV
MHKIKLETNLKKLGIKTQKQINLILKNINLERLSNNPRKVTKKALKEIIKINNN